MSAWLQKILKFYRNDEGATATEYATIVVLLIVVVAATVYSLADFEGDGMAQKAFQKVGNQAGQFGKVQN